MASHVLHPACVICLPCPLIHQKQHPSLSCILKSGLLKKKKNCLARNLKAHALHFLYNSYMMSDVYMLRTKCFHSKIKIHVLKGSNAFNTPVPKLSHTLRLPARVGGGHQARWVSSCVNPHLGLRPPTPMVHRHGHCPGADCPFPSGVDGRAHAWRSFPPPPFLTHTCAHT